MTDPGSVDLFNHPAGIAIIGCGWLGRALAQSLIARKYRVIATSARHASVVELKKQGLSAIQLRLDPNLICVQLDSLQATGIAVVLIPPGFRKGNAKCFPQRIHQLLSHLKQIQVRRIILVSSTSVYPCNNREVDEGGPLLPDTESGRILLDAENQLLSEPGIDGIVLRLAGLCGPGREPGKLLAGKSNLSGANNPVNLIHQQDAVNLLVTLIQHQPWSEIFNGCAPLHPRKIDLYPDAATAMGLQPPRFNRESTPYKIVNGEKPCRLLGFEYLHPDPVLWTDMQPGRSMQDKPVGP